MNKILYNQPSLFVLDTQRFLKKIENEIALEDKLNPIANIKGL